MAKVKSSKQHTLVIRPHRPMKGVMWCLLVLLLLLASGAGGFLYGQYYERQLQQLNPGGRELLGQMRQQVAELEQNQLVDRLALEKARLALKEKESRLQQMDRAVAFYKGVMVPEDGTKGLRIHSLGVVSAGETQKYQVKWVLTQVSKNRKYLTGNTAVEFIGMLAGQRKVFPLEALAVNMPKMGFRFKYFKSFSVEVQLPEGFEVETVSVTAESNGKPEQVVSQQYEWIVQETLVDVG